MQKCEKLAQGSLWIRGVTGDVSGSWFPQPQCLPGTKPHRFLETVVRGLTGCYTTSGGLPKSSWGQSWSSAQLLFLLCRVPWSFYPLPGSQPLSACFSNLLQFRKASWVYRVAPTLSRTGLSSLLGGPHLHSSPTSSFSHLPLCSSASALFYPRHLSQDARQAATFTIALSAW